MSNSEYHPVLHFGEPLDVPVPVTGLHAFNPDDDLYCIDCGHAEIDVQYHGVYEVLMGRASYVSEAVRALYKGSRPPAARSRANS